MQRNPHHQSGDASPEESPSNYACGGRQDRVQKGEKVNNAPEKNALFSQFRAIRAFCAHKYAAAVGASCPFWAVWGFWARNALLGLAGCLHEWEPSWRLFPLLP